MASINKAILGQPAEALRAVADYAQRQGATGARESGGGGCPGRVPPGRRTQLCWRRAVRPALPRP